MRRCFIFIVIVSLISLFATASHAQETVAQPPGYSGPNDPGNFYGQEIQKVVDYLRSIGLNDYANNTELFLKAGKIIIKPLPPEVEGENGGEGGPVYVNDRAFSKTGFDPKRPGDAARMTFLAVTLLHEKYHSENHDIFYRWCNQHFTRFGPNNVEVEAWAYSLAFLDDVIKETLERVKDPKISKQEKEDLLRLASQLLSNKIERVGSYEKEKYGPQLYAPPLLKGLKDKVEKEREKLRSDETVEVGSLIDSHNELEEDVMKKYAAYKETYASTAESDTQACAANIMEIALVVKNRSSKIRPLPPGNGNRETIGPNGEMILYQPTLEEAMKLYLVLDMDVPSELGSQKFFLNSRPHQKIKISSQAKPEYADYILTIPQSVLDQIYMDKNPDGKMRELFDQGKFSFVELESEQAVIEKELDEMLFAYKNIEKIPSSMKSLVVNERANIVINIGDGKEVIRGVAVGGRDLESVKGGLSDATIEFKTTKRVFEIIRDAPDRQAAVLQALNDGSIEYKALKTIPGIKLFGARVFSRFAGLIDKGDFRVASGEKRQITYAGREAVLEGNAHGLNIVVIPGNRDLPVVSSSGYTLGYTNPRAQELIAKQSRIYSRSAGVYQYGITAYENHWLNMDYEPLVPGFATGYSPKELMASAYNGKAYASIGGTI